MINFGPAYKRLNKLCLPQKKRVEGADLKRRLLWINFRTEKDGGGVYGNFNPVKPHFLEAANLCDTGENETLLCRQFYSFISLLDKEKGKFKELMHQILHLKENCCQHGTQPVDLFPRNSYK